MASLRATMSDKISDSGTCLYNIDIPGEVGDAVLNEELRKSDIAQHSEVVGFF